MKPVSFCALVFALSVFFLFDTPILAQDDLRNDLKRSFSKSDVTKVETSRGPGERKRLKVNAVGRSFELDVQPHDLRSPRYRAEDTNMVGALPIDVLAIKTYKGSIVGEPGSEVRLTIDAGKVEGFFETKNNGRLFIEPASKYSSKARDDESVVYRAEDSLNQEPVLCETDIAGKLDIGQQMVGNGLTEGVTMFRVLELATEADLEWVNSFGGPAGANSEILNILNMVEGVYNAELGLSIQVVYQHTWSVNDPYNASDMPGILDAFVDHWNANFGSVPRDAAHLFTAKSAAQSRGLAYVGVICRNSTVSYGLSGLVNWAPARPLITAHEIGHNFGADHVDATQGCANSIMNASLSASTPLSFCAFSQNVITTYASANGSCLSESGPTPTPSPTPTPIPTPTPAPTPPPPTGGITAFDFDADGRADVSVFRPSNGTWYVNGTSTGLSAFRFGLLGDKSAAADYDGDGRSDAAVYRNGIWYRLKSSTNTDDVVNFGLVGDVPSPGDFDGDGKADIAVFRPSTGIWYWISSAIGNTSAVRFGLAADVPLPGDYDGDGRDDINLFRPSDGMWYRLNSSTGAFVAVRFGLSEDKPIAGDFDGDGRSDIAVWRPSNGVWYITSSSTGAFHAQAFGLFGDIPTAADYDGDGRTDLAVFRPSNAVWYRVDSSTGSYSEFRFGLAGDVPVPAYYVP